MDCKLLDSCPYTSTCSHKDLAEFCAYHRLNYNDFASREFVRPIYPSLNPKSDPNYDKLRKMKEEALKKLRKEDLYDPFDPKNFEGFENHI